MLLFQPNPADLGGDNNVIIYRDYSLRKRIHSPAIPERPSAFQKKKQNERDAEKTKV